jgi:Ca2+/Na+ antiporter
MKRKAQVHGFMLGLVIFCALVIIFLLFLSRTNDILRSKSQKEICKSDVYGQTAMGIKPLKNIERIGELIDNRHEFVSDINCPTQEVVIKEKLDTKDGQTKAKKQIASAMYDCWDQFGEGKLELFESKTGTEMYCVMCHHITFKQKDKEIKGFVDYLSDNTIPGSSEVTYTEYLTGYQTLETLSVFKENMDNFMQQHDAKEIITSSDYAVTFFYYKQGYIDKIKSTALGMVGGAVVGTVGGGLSVGVVVGAVTISTGGAAAIGLAIFALGTSIGAVVGSDKSADWNSGVMLVPLQSENLKDLKCGYLPAKQSEKE